MACSVPHTYDEIKCMVEKQIQEDRGRQLAIMNLSHQYGDAIEAKDELLKAYEQCRDISMDKRAMIEKILKIESELDYEMQSALFRKAAKLEKQIRDKLDAAHLKGQYKRTNLIAVSMDGNNQIVPIAFGICKGETALAVQNEFPLAYHVVCCRHLMMNLSLKKDKTKALLWKICKAYTTEEFSSNMSHLQDIQPDAYDKLCQLGPQRCSRAHCPLVRYNYLTSNSESVNACTVVYRKLLVLKLAETYRAMVQDWYYKHRKLAGTCQCRKWQLSGLPCGHVIAVTKYLGLTDCLQFVSDWFKKPKYQGTYAEPIHFIGNVQEWEFPQHIRKAIPPRIDNSQLGRPKNTNRIKSQGEEPRVIHCTRCKQAGYRRDNCNKPFIFGPPINIQTQHEHKILRYEQPSFHNPLQQYDNTFQYSSHPHGPNTYPSQS
ncbi:transposase, MuDR, MULE transposase domain protein [Tanacetum coccineum]